MATIFAGMFHEPYDMKDIHSRIGLVLTYIPAVLILFFVTDPFFGLILSQALLSVQLPFTIFMQIYLTSSERVMGKYANRPSTRLILIGLGVIVTLLNLFLIYEL